MSRYNLRAREKHFQVGDLVLLLSPDTTSARTFSKWQGPAHVMQVCSPHNYVIELDGVRHHVHANWLKRYMVSTDCVSCKPDLEILGGCRRCSHSVTDDSVETDVVRCECMSCGCAVVGNGDEDFGDTDTFELTDSVPQLPSEKIDAQQISHLSPVEQRRLLELLDRYSECFSDDPGFCTLAEHEINLLPDFKPRRLRAYRVPEKLEPQVKQEIKRMLDLGVIRPSNSDMVSPLVVVLKGPGGRDGNRLAVDYSYVNSFTRNDPYPVLDMEGIMNRVASARLVSSFDAAGAYWQTRVRPGDEPLTAFVCDEGIFEFLRTPFGGKACGSTFIRAIQRV